MYKFTNTNHESGRHENDDSVRAENTSIPQTNDRRIVAITINLHILI